MDLINNNDKPLLPFSDEFLHLFHNCIDHWQERKRKIPLPSDKLPKGETEFDVRDCYVYYLPLANPEIPCGNGKIDILGPGYGIEIKLGSSASFRVEQSYDFSKALKEIGYECHLIASGFTTKKPREKTRITESRNRPRLGPTPKEKITPGFIDEIRKKIGVPLYFHAERIGHEKKDRKEIILSLRQRGRAFIASQKNYPWTLEQYDKFCRDRPLPLDW